MELSRLSEGIASVFQRPIAATVLITTLHILVQEAAMFRELAEDRLFGLVLTAICVSVLILNAMSY